MNLDAATQTFLQESHELLADMEDALLALEEVPADEETINTLFRAIHTIKGSSGLFGFDDVVAFTHVVETALDQVRAGERDIDSDLIAVLLSCKDHTSVLVDHALEEDAGPLDEEVAKQGASLLAQLGAPAQPETGADVVAETVPTDQRADEDAPMESDDWHISLRFGPNALRNGMDPISFLRYLKTLGEVVNILTLTHTIPPADEMDPESCYLGFEISFRSDADKERIENVFEFAQDDCEIHILPPLSKQTEYQQLLEALPEDQMLPLGEMLLESRALTRREIEQVLQIQQESKGEAAGGNDKPARMGEILVEQNAVHQPVIDTALKKQDKARENQAKESRYIRVDSDKLGHLINLVGELVTGSATMQVMVGRAGMTELDEVSSGIETLVENIRDSALQLRMVQIGETFNRYRRVVRDMSKGLNKEIDLLISGGETELDKAVVEKITDPLMHLVRNSIDHGIETPEERKAAGKPQRGSIHLNAYHDSGYIVITITDDGGGLDPDVILAKAIANGVVQADQKLTHQEILRLIFSAGLSTKQEVSNLSGRGVGMDVVRRNIEALRGSVDLHSDLGKGTRVDIRLPLTLAIIDGFLVGVGGEKYVIPLSMVSECIELSSESWDDRKESAYISLRGEVLPFLNLKKYFDISSDKKERERIQSLVVVRCGDGKAGLVVDDLYGELQTVIKPLGQIFEKLRGISGATVLGSGDIALILDIAELINAVSTSSETTRPEELVT
jgi:two-component system chemotaxis sensor kinase CheA|tara:strand:- start:2187 stop:4394 length:2208 start_codon:yes stop_codon:yes gene_type:complete